MPAPRTQPDASPALRLAAIARARKRLMQDGAALPAGWIAPWIERSWQRCVALGFEAHQRVAFDQVSAAHMRRTADANRRLVHSARALVEQLARAIVNTRYFVILTNAEGVVVHACGAIDRHDARAQCITRIGTDLSERAIGTAAIGTALAERQSVWLHQGEHFYTDTSVYSCAGAPIFAPDGQCIGMLDLTGIDAPERPELRHLVSQVAARVQNALLQETAHRLQIRLSWPGNSLGSEADGLVCVDADGCITGANQIAREMAPALAASGHSRQSIGDVFGVTPELLFDAARKPDARIEIPLWSGLKLQALPQDGPRENASVLLPRALRTLHHENTPLRDVEVALIRKAVDQAKGNVAKAARNLGIGRATVYRKLAKPR